MAGPTLVWRPSCAGVATRPRRPRRSATPWAVRLCAVSISHILVAFHVREDLVAMQPRRPRHGGHAARQNDHGPGEQPSHDPCRRPGQEPRRALEGDAAQRGAQDDVGGLDPAAVVGGGHVASVGQGGGWRQDLLPVSAKKRRRPLIAADNLCQHQPVIVPEAMPENPCEIAVHRSAEAAEEQKDSTSGQQSQRPESPEPHSVRQRQTPGERRKKE